jgi:hypothetical protein
MRKIEKIDIGYNEDAMRPMLNKINDLVDAVNKLFEWTGGFEQTQEPEMKEPECFRNYDIVYPIIREEKPAKKECEQHLPMTDKDGHPHCANCGRYSYDHEPKKDELAEEIEVLERKVGRLIELEDISKKDIKIIDRLLAMLKEAK